MLTQNEFSILRFVYETPLCSPKEIAETTHLPFDSIEKRLTSCANGVILRMGG